MFRSIDFPLIVFGHVGHADPAVFESFDHAVVREMAPRIMPQACYGGKRRQVNKSWGSAVSAQTNVLVRLDGTAYNTSIDLSAKWGEGCRNFAFLKERVPDENRK
jgi:hypothetical protein